jgi:hypothetical protein
MRRTAVLAILCCGAAVALVFGTAWAGEQPSVTTLKQSSSYVSPTDGRTLWLEGCYLCHRPWGHLYEVPSPANNPPESSPDNQATKMIPAHHVSDHLGSIQGHPALARK